MTSVDFPTLGRPTIATTGSFVLGDVGLNPGKEVGDVSGAGVGGGGGGGGVAAVQVGVAKVAFCLAGATEGKDDGRF